VSADRVAKRAVLSDDGVGLLLVLYGDGREPMAVAALSPRRALYLASELLAAGLRYYDRAPFDPEADSRGCFDIAVRALRARFRDGIELPQDSQFRPRHEEGKDCGLPPQPREGG
jgi:hypothetical protein